MYNNNRSKGKRPREREERGREKGGGTKGEGKTVKSWERKRERGEYCESRYLFEKHWRVRLRGEKRVREREWGSQKTGQNF